MSSKRPRGHSSVNVCRRSPRSRPFGDCASCRRILWWGERSFERSAAKMFDHILRNRLPEPGDGDNQSRSPNAHQRGLIERPLRRIRDAFLIGKNPVHATSYGSYGDMMLNPRSVIPRGVAGPGTVSCFPSTCQRVHCCASRSQ